MNIYITLIALILNNQMLISQNDLKKDSLELWIMGAIGNFELENAHIITSNNWPFKITQMGGDVVDDFLIEKVEEHNSMIWKKLISLGYVNPKENYYNQVKKEHEKISKVVQIVDSNSRINKLIEKIKKKDLNFNTEIIKVRDNFYKLSVFSFNLKDIKKDSRLEFRLSVDLSNSSYA